MANRITNEDENGAEGISSERQNLHLLVNLIALHLTRDMKLAEKAVVLGDAGFTNNRIASLFNSTPDSIRSMRNSARRESNNGKPSKKAKRE